MGVMFSLTEAGRRVCDHPNLYPQHDTEERAILSAIQVHGALSFDDIVRYVVPGEMFKVLQAMATGVAMGLLETDDAAPQQPDKPSKDRGLGHGRW